METERLFLNKPMFLGLANEVPNVGDYIAVDWINGLSILMVRGSDNQVRAFANVCRHRNTLAPFFLGNLSTWESWGGRDMRMILPKQTMLEAKNMPEEQWDMRQFANVFITMAPTMAMLAQPDNISIIKMVPLSPGETRVEEVHLVDPPKDGGEEWSEDELKLHETNFQLVHKILSEDWVLGETIQANMESGAVQEIHFGRFESALTWFHDQYEKEMGFEENIIARVC